MVSALIFVNDFLGISGASEQKQIGKAPGDSSKRSVTANVNKHGVPVCNEDQENPVTFKIKVGRKGTADRRPVYIPLRRDVINVLLGTHT